MEKANSTSLVRTKSDQLVDTLAAMAGIKSPVHSSSGGDAAASGGSSIENGTGSGTLSRKSSRRLAMASPGRNSSGGGGKQNTHIRKWSSAQMKFDMDDVSSGAALSRASSASLGLSFSFTGFNMPPDEISDSKPFSDDDIRKFALLSCVFKIFLIHIFSEITNTFFVEIN